MTINGLSTVSQIISDIQIIKSVLGPTLHVLVLYKQYSTTAVQKMKNVQTTESLKRSTPACFIRFLSQPKNVTRNLEKGPDAHNATGKNSGFQAEDSANAKLKLRNLVRMERRVDHWLYLESVLVEHDKRLAVDAVLCEGC